MPVGFYTGSGGDTTLRSRAGRNDGVGSGRVSRTLWTRAGQRLFPQLADSRAGRSYFRTRVVFDKFSEKKILHVLNIKCKIVSR